MKKTEVIYIIGAGRSGTTLLDIILGNQKEIFSAGELNRFSKRNGVPHSARDERVSEFWESICRKFDKSPKSYLSLCQKLEYHSAVIKNRFVSNQKKDAYLNFNKTLFQSIEQNIDQSVIVDSSKYPMRGYHLSKIFGAQIKYVYIKRSPLSVVNSFQKKSVEQPSKTRLGAHLYLFLVNTLATSILRFLNKKHRTVTITYEELTNKPIETLEKIESGLDINLFDLKKKLRQDEDLQVGSLFDGNRLRLKNTIRIIKSNNENTPKAKHWMDKAFMPLHKVFWY